MQEMTGDVRQNASLIQLPFCLLPLQSLHGLQHVAPLKALTSSPGGGFSMWLAVLSRPVRGRNKDPGDP